MMACELVAEDQVISATLIKESDCVGPYKNAPGSDANLSHCNLVSSSGSAIFALNNPTYSPLAASPESHCAKPETQTDSTQEYKLLVPSACSPLLPSSNSYQALEDSSQPGSNWGNPFESDDLVKSPTSVGLSQPLLGDQFSYVDNMHSQLAPCSDSYQVLEDVCHVKC